MDEDLKLIKKKFGEDMAHFCRGYFSILLETKGLLPSLLLKKFEPSKFLYSDLVKFNLEEKFKNFIYSLIDVEKKREETSKSPEELMSIAGYDLYECKTESDIQRFKKYYHEGEELCTFRGGRLNSCYVFFAVKRDVDSIKREDFKNPKREDLYGTSVISIQFSRDESHLLSIKNRYNHRVFNPDATYSNNLDNIIPGLIKSFEEHYGMKQEVKSHNFEIPGYVLASDDKYYKYNSEINNIYYCSNNIIIDITGVHKYDASKYIILDYFILDLVNKRIYLYDENIDDSFPKTIGEIDKICVLKTDYGKEIRITNTNNFLSIIKINKYNGIISYINENIEKIDNNFLVYNLNLQDISLLNVKVIGDKFLFNNISLQEIELLNVEKIGDDFLSNNDSLRKISLLNIREIGNFFLASNRKLEEIIIPNVKEIGDSFLTLNITLREIKIPNALKIGDFFLSHNIYLKEIDLTSVKVIGNFFLGNNMNLKEINLPNVERIEGGFFYSNKSLEIIIAPKLLAVHPYQRQIKLFKIEKDNRKKLERKENKRLLKK